MVWPLNKRMFQEKSMLENKLRFIQEMPSSLNALLSYNKTLTLIYIFSYNFLETKKTSSSLEIYMYMKGYYTYHEYKYIMMVDE